MKPQQVTRCVKMLWSSASRLYDRIEEQQTYQPVGDPLRGLGMGLTMTRLCTQHWGGDTQITSRQDKGTTVLLCFPKDMDLPERIPRSCHGEYALLT